MKLYAIIGYDETLQQDCLISTKVNGSELPLVSMKSGNLRQYYDAMLASNVIGINKNIRFVEFTSSDPLPLDKSVLA